MSMFVWCTKLYLLFVAWLTEGQGEAEEAEAGQGSPQGS